MTTTEKPPSGLGAFSRRAAAAPVALAHPFTVYTPQAYARSRGAFLQPGDDEPRTDDFVLMTTPVPVRVLVYLGLPERSPPPPGDDTDDPDKPSDARRAWAAERTRSLHILLTMVPGERLLIPRAIVGALVATNAEGTVVTGGLAPHMRLVSDPAPPSMHPSLVENDDVLPFAGGK